MQVRISAEARATPLPAPDDERAAELQERRSHQLAKLEHCKGYMAHRVARDADESDELWRLITDYFGEEDDLEPAWAAAPHPAAAAAAPPPSDAVGIEPSQPAVSAEDEIPF